MRACRALREAAKDASGKKYALTADPYQYHRQPTGFWEKLRLNLSANPTLNTGHVDVVSSRYPQPGSREEVYAKPASKSSDPAQNPYYGRDVRRDYPQTHYVSQRQLAGLLLSEPSRPETLGLPTPTVAEADAKSLVASEEGPSLAALYAGDAASNQFYGSQRLPPKAPAKRKHKYILGEPKPVEDHVFWPMVMYK